MKRIEYDFYTPETFEEHQNFTKDAPYIVRVKRFLHEDIVPLHYGRSIEILLAQNIKGKFLIDNTSYDVDGNHLLVVPPNTVHSNDIQPGPGTLYILKMEFDVLAQFANISAILGMDSTSIQDLPHSYPEETYERLMQIISELIRHDGDFSRCICLIISIFALLKDHVITEEHARFKPLASESGLDLHRLIRWTEDNLSEPIMLEDAARQFGYSKYYFCSKFKAMTGVTYHDYLTSVRIARACKLLLSGMPVREVSYLCGFENVSYFVQLFKKRQCMTPSAYVRSLEKLQQGLAGPVSGSISSAM